MASFKKNLPRLRLQIIVLFILLSLHFSAFSEILSQTALTPEALLQISIKNGALDDVNALLANGISANQIFEDGITPLHLAVIQNQENIVAVLMQRGAILDAQDAITRATPLHFAALYGRDSIAKLLLQKGATVDAEMEYHITPLLVAAQFGQSQMIDLLIKYKADIKHTDNGGFTALHFAAQNNDSISAHLLIQQGAELNTRDKTRQATPLKIAEENKHSAMVQFLKESGASE